MGRELGTVPNPDSGLRLAGQTLPGDQLTLSLQNVTDALLPRAGPGPGAKPPLGGRGRLGLRAAAAHPRAVVGGGKRRVFSASTSTRPT
ncbi:MAG: hypothetical protein WKG07_06125 [Hymenobacter sp.]